MIQVAYSSGTADAVRVDQIEENEALGLLLSHLPLRSIVRLPWFHQVNLELIIVEVPARECRHDGGWPARYDTLTFSYVATDDAQEMFSLYKMVCLYLFACQGHAADDLIVSLGPDQCLVPVETASTD